MHSAKYFIKIQNNDFMEIEKKTFNVLYHSNWIIGFFKRTYLAKLSYMFAFLSKCSLTRTGKML